MKVTTGPRAIYIPADGSLEIGSATGCLFTGDIPKEFLDWDKDRRDRLQRETIQTAVAAARTDAERLRKDLLHAENRISAKNSIIIGLGALLGMAGVVIIFALATP